MSTLAKILIIDDNPKLMQDALPMYGYEVECATDGLMGLKLLDEKQDLDLINNFIIVWYLNLYRSC